METTFLNEFRQILRLFERELNIQNTFSCCNGVTVAQCHTLLEIEKRNLVTVTELAEKLNLDKSTVSRTVDGLVNIGLLNRDIPAQNRRKAELSLTENGKKMCTTINCTNNTFFESAFEGFSAQEKQDFLSLFSKFTSNMQNNREEATTCCKS